MTSVRSILAFALLFATITGSFASVPAPVCYTRSQKCCYNFRPCGVIVKRVKVVTKCPFKKCGFKICKNVCKFITVQVPKKVCKKVKTPTGKETCKKVKVPGPKPGVYIWRKVCTKDYITKNVCKIIKVPTKKRVCEKVCSTICKTIPAICVKFAIYNSPKFCPRRSCTKFTITGSTVRPKIYIGAQKLIKHTPVVRTPRH